MHRVISGLTIGRIMNKYLGTICRILVGSLNVFTKKLPKQILRKILQKNFFCSPCWSHFSRQKGKKFVGILMKTLVEFAKEPLEVFVIKFA